MASTPSPAVPPEPDGFDLLSIETEVRSVSFRLGLLGITVTVLGIFLAVWWGNVISAVGASKSSPGMEWIATGSTQFVAIVTGLSIVYLGLLATASKFHEPRTFVWFLRNLIPASAAGGLWVWGVTLINDMAYRGVDDSTIAQGRGLLYFWVILPFVVMFILQAVSYWLHVAIRRRFEEHA